MSVGDPPQYGTASAASSAYYYQVPPPEIDYERLAEEIVKRLPPLPPMYPYYVPYYPVYPQPYYPTWPQVTWTVTCSTDTSVGA